MVGWHHQLNEHQFGQGGLACCSPWGGKELDMTERLSSRVYLFFFFNFRSSQFIFFLIKKCIYSFIWLCQVSVQHSDSSLWCAGFSPVAVLGLQSPWAQQLGTRAQLSQSMQDISPQPGVKATSPALQGRFLITGPPGKSWPMTIKMRFWWDILLMLISHTHHHQGRRPESPSAFTILGIENISRVNLLGFFRTGMRMKYPAPCLVVLK